MNFILENMEHILAIGLITFGAFIILASIFVAFSDIGSDIPSALSLAALGVFFVLSGIALWKSNTIESSHRIEPELKITEFRSGDVVVSDTIFIYKRPK